MTLKGVAVGASALIVLAGCAATETPPAPGGSDTQKQDDAYVALRSKDAQSPRIPAMIVRLIQAHTDAEEYRLARFYCDEYRRDYPSGKDRQKVEYLRIRALYLWYKQDHDMLTAQQVDAEVKAFLTTFPRSAYRSKAKAIGDALRREQNGRYKALADYYAKKGKPKAAQFYRDKIVD
jgi:outer membrane protein assembly factor BamD